MSELVDYEGVDRTGWPKGPWDGEPDRVEWRLPELPQYPLLITRNPMLGNLCGYIAVPPGHPAYGMHYRDLGDIDAHGSITYSKRCSGHICHVPRPGEPDDVWWLGFDCGHSRDLQPGMLAMSPGLTHIFEGLQYPSLSYVKAECESIARQLHAMTKPKEQP